MLVNCSRAGIDEDTDSTTDNRVSGHSDGAANGSAYFRFNRLRPIARESECQLKLVSAIDGNETRRDAGRSDHWTFLDRFNRSRIKIRPRTRVIAAFRN